LNSEQVSDFFLVNFDHAHLNSDIRVTTNLNIILENHFDYARYQAFILGFPALHGVGFAGGSLAVRENRAIKPFENT
jgi:hypothetical protein